MLWLHSDYSRVKLTSVSLVNDDVSSHFIISVLFRGGS